MRKQWNDRFALLNNKDSRMHPRLPALLEEIDSALKSMTTFLGALEKEGAKLYGSEGANAGMRRALQAMNTCFDWSQWIKRRPTRDCVAEFGVLCEMLQPLLRHTQYPSSQEFPAVRHAWPDKQVAQPKSDQSRLSIAQRSVAPSAHDR